MLHGLEPIRPGYSGRIAVALLAITALAAGLRLYRLGAESLWFDEADTWRMTSVPLAEFRQTLLRYELTPPLFFLAARLSTRLAGDSEVALRLPSVLAGILAVPIAGQLAGRLLGRRTGLAGALLVAVSPTLIWYSQEARSYSLYTLLVLGSSWALVEAWQSNRRAAWLAYGALTLALPYTHYLSGYFMLTQAAMVAYAALRRRGSGDRRWRAWLACVTVAGLFYLPYLPTFAGHRFYIGEWLELTYGAMRPLDHLKHVTHIVVVGWTFPAEGGLALAAYSLAGGLALLGLWPPRRPGAPPVLGGLRGADFAALSLAAPLLAAWLVSQFHTSLAPRGMLPVAPFLWMLIARGALRLRPAVVSGAALAVVAGGLLWSLTLAIAHPARPDWRGVAGYLAEHARPGEAVSLDPYYHRLVLRYYLRDRLVEVPDLTEDYGPGRFWLVEAIGASGELGRRLDDRYPKTVGPAFGGMQAVAVYDVSGE